MVKEKLIKDTAIIQSDAINIISTKVSNKTYDKDSIDKKQYNIAYKGKNNVMKVMDIFKNIHFSVDLTAKVQKNLHMSKKNTTFAVKMT